jgi:DNA replication and repair protein RecF
LYLQKLSLSNFRSFLKKELTFSPQTTLITGANASGKTNILEAIYLLATGKSFHASREEEMIHTGSNLAKIEGKGKGSDKIDLEVWLTGGQVQGQNVARKIFKVNGVNRRWKDFVGNLRCVLFRPEDIDIIIGSPVLRRHFLNSVLEQVDWRYRACNVAYKKGLRQRNIILEKIREGFGERLQLSYWDQLLIKNGDYLNKKRTEFIAFLNKFLYDNQQLHLNGGYLKIYYDHSVISPERLKQYEEAEVAAGITLVGPHRDDIKILEHPPAGGEKIKKDRDLGIYGSRGEQRMAILALKLAELEFIHHFTQERPLLLLDDIFSELDKEHRKQIFQIIPRQQTIITSTDTEVLVKNLQLKLELIKLS